MENMFYNKKESNQFDNIKLNIKKLYKNFPFDKKINPKPNLVFFSNSKFHKIYSNRFIPKVIRTKLWHIFKRFSLDFTWFDEFHNYWKKIIKGRPLFGLQDLFFLKNIYRMKFQSNQVPDTNDPYIHLKAWQRPELIYQLLHSVCKEFLSNQLSLLNLSKNTIKKNKSILEFGCGTAPIITSLYEFYKLPKSLKIYISDIQSITFHYAAYKFRRCSNVLPILLTPENDFLLTLDKKVDLIFCNAVFEHLNKPLETVKIFKDILNINGLLIFDYVKTSGDFLDTQHSVQQRNSVLNFIINHFKIIQGKININGNVGLTVVKKK